MSYGTRKAVEDVYLTIQPKDRFGIAGESGCGKSTLAMNVLKILPKYAENPLGKIIFKGKDVLKLSDKQMRQIRGKEISMVFQEPMTALSPVHRVGTQIIKVIQTHESKSPQEAFDRSVKLFSLVRISNPQDIMYSFPHQLSGGMRQRVMIAMALACNPLLLIMDEPTSALDTVTQMELIKLLEELQEKIGMTLLLISHNLFLIKHLCKKVGIMYLGRIVETGDTDDIFNNPKHPYTKGLLESLPDIDDPIQEFNTIEGDVPDSMFKPSGCTFHPRCSYSMPICTKEKPEHYTIKKNHTAACFLYKK
jgi:oligopeptide/dipeptide ABC transporter ATP-binding protein